MRKITRLLLCLTLVGMSPGLYPYQVLAQFNADSAETIAPLAGGQGEGSISIGASSLIPTFPQGGKGFGMTSNDTGAEPVIDVHQSVQTVSSAFGNVVENLKVPLESAANLGRTSPESAADIPRNIIRVLTGSHEIQAGGSFDSNLVDASAYLSADSDSHLENVSTSARDILRKVAGKAWGLLVSDYDGTLVDEKNGISDDIRPEVLEEIVKRLRSGEWFVINTARFYEHQPANIPFDYTLKKALIDKIPSGLRRRLILVGGLGAEFVTFDKDGSARRKILADWTPDEKIEIPRAIASAGSVLGIETGGIKTVEDMPGHYVVILKQDDPRGEAFAQGIRDEFRRRNLKSEIIYNSHWGWIYFGKVNKGNGMKAVYDFLKSEGRPVKEEDVLILADRFGSDGVDGPMAAASPKSMAINVGKELKDRLPNIENLDLFQSRGSLEVLRTVNSKALQDPPRVTPVVKKTAKQSGGFKLTRHVFGTIGGMLAVVFGGVFFQSFFGFDSVFVSLGLSSGAIFILGIGLMIHGDNPNFWRWRAPKGESSPVKITIGSTLAVSALLVAGILILHQLHRLGELHLPSAVKGFLGAALIPGGKNLLSSLQKAPAQKVPNPDGFFAHAYALAKDKAISTGRAPEDVYFVRATTDFNPRDGASWKFQFQFMDSAEADVADVFYVDFHLKQAVPKPGAELSIPDDVHSANSYTAQYTMDQSFYPQTPLEDGRPLAYRVESPSFFSRPFQSPDKALSSVQENAKSFGAGVSVSLQLERDDERALWRPVYRLRNSSSRTKTVDAIRSQVTDDLIRSSADRVIEEKDSHHAESEYNASLHNTAQSLIYLGASEVQINEFYRLCSES